MKISDYLIWVGFGLIISGITIEIFEAINNPHWHIGRALIYQ